MSETKTAKKTSEEKLREARALFENELRGVQGDLPQSSSPEAIRNNQLADPELACEDMGRLYTAALQYRIARRRHLAVLEKRKTRAVTKAAEAERALNAAAGIA